LKAVQQQARSAGIDSSIPDFIAGYFERAVSAGYENEDVAALVKVLRDGRS
jgi:3-hydroxyisobutyrate dehydrogenase-like beta-hydroxyacid dehydrogenase